MKVVDCVHFFMLRKITNLFLLPVFICNVPANFSVKEFSVIHNLISLQLISLQNSKQRTGLILLRLCASLPVCSFVGYYCQKAILFKKRITHVRTFGLFYVLT
jgi:hypothetical protein